MAHAKRGVAQPTRDNVDNNPTSFEFKDSLASIVGRFLFFAAAGSALMTILELIDLNIKLGPVFESSAERLTLAVYTSLNVAGAAIVGTVAGGIAYVLIRARRLGGIVLARRGPARLWQTTLVVLILSGFTAFLLNQQPTIHRYIIGLIREAEKIESLNQPLLNHERSTSYLLLTAAVALCWIVAAVARRAGRMNRFAVVGLSLLIAGGIAIAYYVDSTIEVQLYEHSLHLTAFLVAQILAMALTAIILSRWSRPRAGRRRLIVILIAASVVVAGSVFTFANFDRNQNLKTQIHYRSTQSKQFVWLFQWILDFDRDGYSAFLGGGDCDDRRTDVNPSRAEIAGDGLDNNCAGGELTRADLDEWNRERALLRVSPDPAAKRLNVIYVFVDALRADHLGLYGYSRNTSPNLDKLAAVSSVFENAYTPAPNTFEALPKFTQSSYWDAHLETWPQILARNGYDTLLFPRRITTLTRHVKGMKVVPEARVPTFAETVDKAIEVLGRQPVQSPFAAYLYSTDPHRPYLKHDEYDFGSSNTDLYDAEISYTDAQLGRLVNWLESTDRLRQTMILIMADHGESLGERSTYKHSSQLYNEQARVPMIIHFPGVEPRRLSQYVSTIDLGATILNAVGLEYPAECSGVSLVPLMRGQPFVHPPVFAEQTGQEVSPYVQPAQNVHPETKKYMVITQDGFKLIYNRNVNSFELFDLNRDYREERNLFDREPARATELWRLLARFIDVVTASRPWDADETQYYIGPAARQDQ